MVKMTQTKTYLVTWYEGSMLDVEKKIVEKSVEVPFNIPIEKVNYINVLPSDVKTSYSRIAYISPNEITIDYGSHNKFIRIKRVEE